METVASRARESMPNLITEALAECLAETTAVPPVRQTMDTIRVLTLGCDPRDRAVVAETLAELQLRLVCNAYLRGIRDSAGLFNGAGQDDTLLAIVEKAIRCGGDVPAHSASRPHAAMRPARPVLAH